MTELGAYEMNRVYSCDALELLAGLPDNSVNCIVTSPPYYGLRDYGVDGQLGLEETPDTYVAALVGVFREARRVLRDDGTVWLNLGDSYAGSGAGGGGNRKGNEHGQHDALTGIGRPDVPNGLKPKDLLMIPARVALALQADGWWLRSDIIWAKPNPMPESVTDRPTKSHEHVFLLAKSASYWYDADAIKEANSTPSGTQELNHIHHSLRPNNGASSAKGIGGYRFGSVQSGRNKRDVWTIPTQPYPGAHFAVMPEELVRLCVLAGCPDTVCAVCGAPHVRVVQKPDMSQRPTRSTDSKLNTDEVHVSNNWQDYPKSAGQKYQEWRNANPDVTLGFEPTCACNAGTRMGVTLDMFMGSGTVARVAHRLGRRYIGCDINPAYVEMANKSLGQMSMYEALP